jgi:hypothetical protein
MASVMAIGSEVFGSCVGEINVSVEVENRGVALLWVEIFENYFWRGKCLANGCGGGGWCQVLEAYWVLVGLD